MNRWICTRLACFNTLVGLWRRFMTNSRVHLRMMSLRDQCNLIHPYRTLVEAFERTVGSINLDKQHIRINLSYLRTANNVCSTITAWLLPKQRLIPDTISVQHFRTHNLSCVEYKTEAILTCTDNSTSPRSESSTEDWTLMPHVILQQLPSPCIPRFDSSISGRGGEDVGVGLRMREERGYSILKNNYA